MSKLPSIFGKLSSQLMHMLGVPAFFLFFIMLYQPARLVAILDVEAGSFNFNTIIVMCIVFGVMLLSRVLLLVLYGQSKLDWLRYIAWEVAELVIMSMFVALYLTLMNHKIESYFHMVGQSAYMLTIVNMYPYLIFNLALAYAAQKEDSADFDASLMRFVDSTQRVKLMIASSAVQYIKAEENYVHICYLEGDRLKDYVLRASMKSLEGLMQKHGLIRCQRSYYINPQHINLLRRDKEGLIYAELNTPTIKPIPVSPKYYEDLAKWL